MQQIEKDVWDLINPGVEELHLRLVRVRLSGSGNGSVLQIMVEPETASKDLIASVTIDECAEVSRMASALLDVEDLIESKYTLEVSSTGLERPLVTLSDFERYVGTRVAIKMAVPIEKRFKFKGILEKVEDEMLHVFLEEESVSVPLTFAHVQHAKRYFTAEEMNEIFKKAEEK